MEIAKINKKIKSFSRKNVLELLAFSFCFLILFFALKGVLINEVIAGWDTAPHFYIFSKMLEFLKGGHVTGYDPNWFAGYPAFSFYGPLPYMIMALVHFISFGLLDSALSFNLVLFLIPFLFLCAVFYTGRIYFGKITSVIALFLATMLLLSSKDYAMYGIGIHSIVYLGLFANFMALSFLIFLIGNLEKLRKTLKMKYMVINGLLLGMIILTHSMTMIFSGIVLGIFTLTNFRVFWKYFLGIMGIGILVSSFWLVPFILNMDFSSAYKMGMAFTGLTDPLFVLFPKLEHVLDNFSPGLLPVLFSFIFTIIGLHALFKKKIFFWAYLFIFTLVILPRDYLVNFLSTPLHYYRFLAHLAVINVFVMAMGFTFSLEKISGWRLKHNFVYRSVLIAFLIVSFLFTSVDFFNLRRDPLIYTHNLHLEQYPRYANAQEMMAYIASMKPEGRVAVQTNQYFQDQLGSPHYFSALLPLKYDVAVLPGLLAESALSTQYVLPVLSTLGNTFNWGNTTLVYDPYFSSQGLEEMVKRLELYNVQYILRTQNDFASNSLKDSEEVYLEKEIGDFVLLGVKHFRPLLEPIKYKPFLFVSEEGMDFITFSKEWFKSLKLLNYPVIYTKKDWEELSGNDQKSIGGLIVSFSQSKALSLEEYQQWTALKEKVIFLNAHPTFKMSEQNAEDTYFVKDFGVGFGTVELEKVLVDFMEADKQDAGEITNASIEDEDIKFTSNSGVLINYSYFPRWESKNPAQTIFWATPSMMFVFGEGENELEYE